MVKEYQYNSLKTGRFAGVRLSGGSPITQTNALPAVLTKVSLPDSHRSLGVPRPSLTARSARRVRECAVAPHRSLTDSDPPEVAPKDIAYRPLLAGSPYRCSRAPWFRFREHEVSNP